MCQLTKYKKYKCLTIIWPTLRSDLFESILGIRYNIRALIEKEGIVRMGHKSPVRVGTGSSSKPGQAKPSQPRKK